MGISARSNNQLALNPITGEIAYPVGSFLCIYNSKLNKQVKFLENDKNRHFWCVAYSQDGKYIAAGEGTTKQPEITIWQINEESYEVFGVLKGHKLCIETLVFSPNQKYLISIGDEHDKGLLVWDIERKIMITCNKLSKNVNCVSFAENGSYFVTGGALHLKFWYFDE